MFRSLHLWKFSTQKHFKDQKYDNLNLFSQNKIGSLRHISETFSNQGIDLTYIKSHFCNAWNENKKFMLELSIAKQSEEKIHLLQQILQEVSVSMEKVNTIQVPWFPRNKQELNLIGSTLLDVKDEFNKDSLQFTDYEYRKRRDQIAEVSKDYKYGDKIPEIQFTNDQTKLWKYVYRKLRSLHHKSMSERYEVQIEKLQKQFMMFHRIPQLSELSTYLKNKTGFTIKPTHGILSQRQFLNALAFRVFCCTQYLRNSKTPDYTPEPDLIHEVVGHVPMFADMDVAEISQQIGLLSLGASDKQIAQLGTLYWFTLQFGVCKEGNKNLGYGAGIASSVAEIEHLSSSQAQFQKLEPIFDANAAYPIQKVQETYRVVECFNEALKDLDEYGHSILKPMTTTFNFQTQTIQYDRNIEGNYFQDLGPKF